MYSTCLFCHTDLGKNEVIERFLIGRRLAFDAAKGRLWVVCRACERWNLTPLEERWEAIEECERRYRDTKLRVSTENVGMARLGEGLELVRIGAPRRPEFAAWRYGDQFGRRRRSTMLKVGVGVGAFGVAFGGVLIAGAEVGIGIGSFGWMIYQVGANAVQRIVHGNPRAVVTHLPMSDGSWSPVQRRHLADAVLRVTKGTNDWRIVVPHNGGIATYEGEDAMRPARLLLPAINRFGATREQVSDAVKLMEQADSPSDLFVRSVTGGSPLSKLAPEARIAMEMAAHDELERRAMEGELARLEQEWREAEEIAAIADDMFLPPGTQDFLTKNRPR